MKRFGPWALSLCVLLSAVVLFGVSFAAAEPSSAAPKPASAAPKPASVVVKKGEYLSLIGKRYGLSVEQLRRWNGLKSSVIHPGQRLLLRPRASFAVKLSRKPVLGVPVAVVHVNLAHPDVSIRPLLPPPGLGRGGEVLQRLAWRSQLVAAINGGYFHPHTYWPAGDLVVRGEQLARGKIRTALAITPSNQARVFGGVGGVRPASWSGYETVIANGPYVLRGGKVVVQPRLEGYRDPAIWNRARRSAVGIVSERYLVFVSTPAKLTLSELAKVMARIGAKDALVLDGGSSTGMIWKNQILVRPARPLSYAIGVFVNK